MDTNAPAAILQIRLFKLEEQGYPVELECDGLIHPRGYVPAAIAEAAPGASSAEEGERLFRQLLADERTRTAWAEIRGQHPQRRLRLRIDDEAPELHALPWEALYDPTPGTNAASIGADTDTPLSRYWPPSRKPPGRVGERPVRMLVAIASPRNLAAFQLAPIDVAAELASLREALAGVDPAELELTVLDRGVTLAALEAALKKGPHLLHFIGHGQFSRRSGKAMLYLEDDAGDVALAPDEAIADLLARLPPTLRLAFLASCQSATRSPADAFRGLAPRLLAGGVPAVIAMQDLVPMETARTFARAFYAHLFRHGHVDLAANEARSEILTRNLPGGAIPVLFTRAADTQLLAPRPAPSPSSLSSSPGAARRPVPDRVDDPRGRWVVMTALRHQLLLDVRDGGAVEGHLFNATAHRVFKGTWTFAADRAQLQLRVRFLDGTPGTASLSFTRPDGDRYAGVYEGQMPAALGLSITSVNMDALSYRVADFTGPQAVQPLARPANAADLPARLAGFAPPPLLTTTFWGPAVVVFPNLDEYELDLRADDKFTFTLRTRTWHGQLAEAGGIWSANLDTGHVDLGLAQEGGDRLIGADLSATEEDRRLRRFTGRAADGTIFYWYPVETFEPLAGTAPPDAPAGRLHAMKAPRLFPELPAPALPFPLENPAGAWVIELPGRLCARVQLGYEEQAGEIRATISGNMIGGVEMTAPPGEEFSGTFRFARGPAGATLTLAIDGQPPLALAIERREADHYAGRTDDGAEALLFPLTALGWHQLWGLYHPPIEPPAA